MAKQSRIWRSRWAAVGAAVAVTLGAGGLVGVSASSPESVFVSVTPVRVLDTRIDVGLVDGFVSETGRVLDVTGTVPVVLPGNVPGSGAPVPDGATAIVANVTAVSPSTSGFVSVRPGDIAGKPTTSSLNFTAGAVVPNSVTVELPASGLINLYFKGTSPTATTDLLVDIVGYYVAGSGTVGPKGDKGDVGPKGDKGDVGPKGDRGAVGPRGLSAWDTIPSGVTVSGAFVRDMGSDGVGEDYWFEINYPAMLTSAPTSVNFAADTNPETIDDDATCTGSVFDPTAPAGKVCVYLDGVDNASDLNASPMAVAPTRAFLINFGAAVASGDLRVWAVWAYTAP